MRKIWDCETDFVAEEARERGQADGSAGLRKATEDYSATIAFMLLPGFSLLGLSTFLTVFDNLNSILGKARFRWTFASGDGKPVKCSLGFERSVTQSFAEVKPGPAFHRKVDLVVLVAGANPEGQNSFDLANTVRLCRRQKVPVVALGTATWLLAEIGVLQGAVCTIHWEKLAAFIETFDGPEATDAIFVEDDGIWSCAGETAAFDLAIGIIETELGRDHTEELCRRGVADRPRNGAARQTKSAWLALGAISDKLVDAIELMEQNISEPIDLMIVARRLKVSRRQLERLFITKVGSSPYKFYLRLRLDRARQLIEQTNLRLVDVAVACGFVSTSHFSKCFREHFGVTPTYTRQTRGAGIDTTRVTSRLLCA